MRTFAALCVLLFCVGAGRAGEPVGPYLQSISVNVQASTSQGSGTIFLVPRKGENQKAFVLTAYHVVRGLRNVRTAINDGKERKVVKFNDAKVVQEVPNQDSTRIVGDTSLDAKVVCVDETRDIALLLVRARGRFTKSARFCGATVLPVGTQVLHCGAPGGKDTGGSATLTSGIVSRTGVRIKEFGGADGIFDQLAIPSLPGSSGGMVCRADTGEWIGMITLGLGNADSFAWAVPVRSVRAWAEEAKIPWLLDEKATKAPSDDEISKIPLEVTAGVTGQQEKEGKEEDRLDDLRPERRIVPLNNPEKREVRTW